MLQTVNNFVTSYFDYKKVTVGGNVANNLVVATENVANIVNRNLDGHATTIHNTVDRHATILHDTVDRGLTRGLDIADRAVDIGATAVEDIKKSKTINCCMFLFVLEKCVKILTMIFFIGACYVYIDINKPDLIPNIIGYIFLPVKFIYSIINFIILIKNCIFTYIYSIISNLYIYMFNYKFLFNSIKSVVPVIFIIKLLQKKRSQDN